MKINYLLEKRGFDPDDVSISHLQDWKEADNFETSTWFSSPLWGYGDYSGTTVERSNYESLKKFLDNNNIKYLVVLGHYSYKTLAIKSSEWKDGNELDNLIQRLDNYPLVDEDHFLQLEGQLEQDYLTGDFKQYEVKSDKEITDEDILDAYYKAYDTIGYGIEFETGCTPYLHQELKDEIITELKLKGYKDAKI